MHNSDLPPDTSTESADTPGFYGRWSQRKQQVRDGQLPAPVSDTAVGDAEITEAAPQIQEAPPPLTDTDMPSVESLDGDSDYSGFLSAGVSEDLRNKALRKFFLSPQFNIVDGLDDYAEDFTNFELLGDIVTSDMRYEQEYQAQRITEQEQMEQQQLTQQADSDVLHAEQADALQSETETETETETQTVDDGMSDADEAQNKTTDFPTQDAFGADLEETSELDTEAENPPTTGIGMGGGRQEGSVT